MWIGRFQKGLQMTTMQSEQIKIDSIIIGARARKDFGDIEELAKSISDIGLLQPILVTPFEDGMLLLDGHRRILAFQKLGRETIPVVMFDPLGTQERPHNITKNLQAEHDANVVRKDFTPSEKVWMAEKVKHWIETTERPEKDKQDAQENQLKNQGVKFTPNDEATLQEKSLPKGKKTRDVIADSVGMSFLTLEKAKAIVEDAKQNPENTDLVEKMDQTGKVDPVYKELQNRKNGNLPPGKSAGIDNLPEGNKIVSLIVKMPDGRQKKMGSISNEWWQNKNVLQWIIEGVGLGVDEKDIIIHREGNIVKIFDSTNVEGLRQGVRYLVDRYSFQGSLMDVIEKEQDHENLPG